jgi:hypothetical protein
VCVCVYSDVDNSNSVTQARSLLKPNQHAMMSSVSMLAAPGLRSDLLDDTLRLYEKLGITRHRVDDCKRSVDRVDSVHSANMITAAY